MASVQIGMTFQATNQVHVHSFVSSLSEEEWHNELMFLKFDYHNVVVDSLSDYRLRINKILTS